MISFFFHTAFGQGGDLTSNQQAQNFDLIANAIGPTTSCGSYLLTSGSSPPTSTTEGIFASDHQPPQQPNLPPVVTTDGQQAGKVKKAKVKDSEKNKSNQTSPHMPVVDLNNETESNHDTALTLACAGGHDELVALLLEKGSDIGEYVG